MINGGVIYGVSEPATAYIHYTRVVCQWLLRGDLTLQWREYVDRPGRDVICPVAVGKQYFRVPNCIFGTNKIHPDGIFLLLLSDFLLLSEIVNIFLCIVRINWKCTIHSQFEEGGIV